MKLIKVIILIIILILIIAGYFLFKGSTPAPVLNSNENEPQVNNNEEPKMQPQEVFSENLKVTYTDSGYSPKELTIKVGDTVTWKNEGSSGMWTASALHPTHVIYSGSAMDDHCPDPENITFDQCKSAQPGESWSFTFNKAGTWKYHNHVNASHSGTIIVK